MYSTLVEFLDQSVQRYEYKLALLFKLGFKNINSELHHRCPCLSVVELR